MISVTAIFTCASTGWQHNPDLKFQNNTREIDFPVEIKGESEINTLVGRRWEAILLIAKEHYSKENLDRLFSWYSSKHKEAKWMMVKVYTDVGNLPNPAKKPSASNNKTQQRSYNAIFWKDKALAAVSWRENEWYSYSPDLSNPNYTKTVVLRGKSPYSEPLVTEDLELSNHNLKIKASSYTLKNVEPSGYYHSFFFSTRGNEDWTEIMTLRTDEKQSISQRQIRFMSQQFTYVFLGWKYAATIDGGKTWFGWDAERGLPDWKCCDYNLIRDVQITQDGSGTMTLNWNNSSRESNTIMYTKDYGKHWSSN